MTCLLYACLLLSPRLPLLPFSIRRPSVYEPAASAGPHPTQNLFPGTTEASLCGSAIMYACCARLNLLTAFILPSPLMPRKLPHRAEMLRTRGEKVKAIYCAPDMISQAQIATSPCGDRWIIWIRSTWLGRGQIMGKTGGKEVKTERKNVCSAECPQTFPQWKEESSVHGVYHCVTRE